MVNGTVNGTVNKTISRYCPFNYYSIYQRICGYFMKKDDETVMLVLGVSFFLKLKVDCENP